MEYTINQKIHFNHCKCGWWFPSLSPLIKKCPQCRDDQRSCEQCGVPISGHHHKIYCDTCRKERTNILQKYTKRDKKLLEKYENSDRKNLITDKSICDYDCFNCKFSECLLPIDKEDMETGRMF